MWIVLIIIGAVGSALGLILSFTGIGAICGIPILIVSIPIEILGIYKWRQQQVNKFSEKLGEKIGASIRAGIAQNTQPQQVYIPPSQQGYTPSVQQTYANAPQQAYTPPPQQVYTPQPQPSQQVYASQVQQSSIICPSCGASNPVNNKFCGNCAGALSISKACPACGASNPSGNKFCGECAGPLTTSGQLRPLPQLPPENPPLQLTAGNSVVGTNCIHCSESLTDDSIFCENCGKQVICQKCNTPLARISKSCQNCGETLLS
jgi:hypothetical protein